MTDINDLSKEIVKSLKQYTTSVEEDLENVQDEVAKSAVQELKSNSPKRNGEYAKSWTKKRIKGLTTTGKSQVVIYNSKHGQLTHLLENGHAKKNGGRVAPIIHIKPVEERIINEVQSKTISRLSK